MDTYCELGHFVFGTKTEKYLEYLQIVYETDQSELIPLRSFIIEEFAAYVHSYSLHLSCLRQLINLLCIVCDDDETKIKLQNFFSEYELFEKIIMQQDLERAKPEQIWSQIEQIIILSGHNLIKFVNKCYEELDYLVWDEYYDQSEKVEGYYNELKNEEYNRQIYINQHQSDETEKTQELKLYYETKKADDYN